MNNNEFYIHSDFIKDYKSKLVVGNVTMYCTKKFTWFQRKMLNIFFGFEAKNLESKGE